VARKDDGYVCECGVLISRQRDREIISYWKIIH
jgi:hypothetical protein